MIIKDKTVVLGVTGGIAAYKAADIASKLTQYGAKVDVIMTREATEFVNPLTFRALTRRPVFHEMFKLSLEKGIGHIGLAEVADVILIAPATANIIAKLASGIADDLLCCTVLAARVPVILAPGMNVNMYQNPVTQENLARLRSRGFVTVGPAYGRLASGIMGLGRLADMDDILGVVRQVLGRNGDLAGRQVVVTAGGTQEPLDPVRYISNRSSGKMGYALAEAARDRGAAVRLITAPTALPRVPVVEVVEVVTAAEMKEAVAKAVAKADALIMAAAVADYAPATMAPSKIKKKSGSLTIELSRTPDILGEVRGEFIKVGFAAETEDMIENATLKLKQKNLDFIVANDVTAAGSGFGSDTNKVVLIDRQGRREELPLLPKTEVAERVLDKVVAMIKGKSKEL